MTLDDFKKYNIPNTSGVYFFHHNQEIIYIGKATSLKNRIRSYFSNDLIKTRGLFLVDMITKSTHITYKETENALEALLLESELIKNHKPYYNTKEKDDKSKSFISISKDLYPILEIKRGKDLNTQNYDKVFGPFLSYKQVNDVLKILRKIFPYRDNKCDGIKTCFNGHLHLCPYCTKKLNTDEYKKQIYKIKLFLSGQNQKVMHELEQEMDNYAENMNFENAATIRDQINKIKHINDINFIKDINIRKQNSLRYEAYDIAHLQGSHMIGVMIVFDGYDFQKNEYKKFNIQDINQANDIAALKQVLTRRFKHKDWIYPDIIIVDGNSIQLKAAEDILKDFNLYKKIKIVSVVKDDKHKAFDILTNDNISIPDLRENIIKINAEAHRFAINTHRKKRDNDFLK